MIRLENRLNNIEEVSLLHSLQDVNTDLITMILGQKIGSGSFRSVYEYNFNPDKFVVKIEPNNTDCNITEYTLWKEIKGLTGELAWVKDWFAPIEYCSPNGKILIMKRTYDLTHKEKPRKIPNFMTDVKENNFGWLNNKFVCHDYGFLYKFIKYEKKFKKIDW